jgi:hypothetical protein
MRVLFALLASIAAAPLAGQAPPRWSLVPELRIGGQAATEAEYEFTTVRHVAVGPTGAMYVTQGLEQEIRVYDAQGKYVRTIGRKGGGPGEFMGLGTIGFVGDTLYTTDFQQRRITLFRADGSLITTIVADASQGSLRTDSVVFRPSPVVLLADGTALGSASYASHLVANGQITRAPVYRLTRTARVLETVAWLPVGSGQGAVQSGSSALFFIQPVSDAPMAEFAAKAGRLYMVERAARAGSNTFRVTAIAARGDTLWDRSFPYRPLPLGPGVADSILNVAARRFSGGRGGFTSDQIRKAVFIPDHQVTVTRVIVATDGSLWLRREEFGDPIAWTVIDPQGRIAATLSLPRNVRPMTVVGDNVWGVELDDVDVPTLVRWRVRK